jgi:hypothetical protein
MSLCTWISRAHLPFRVRWAPQGQLAAIVDSAYTELGIALTEQRLAMTGLDALQSVQFVTSKGKRLAVLDADDWESLIEWLETLEDAQIARQAFGELKTAGGSRKKAGWLEWDAIKGKLATPSTSRRPRGRK